MLVSYIKFAKKCRPLYHQIYRLCKIELSQKCQKLDNNFNIFISLKKKKKKERKKKGKKNFDHIPKIGRRFSG